MNLHYAFWVSYYEDLWKASKVLSTDGIRRSNQSLTNQKWKQGERKTNDVFGVSSLCFKVGYPGLLSGLGNAHASGKKEQSEAPEISLGFLLDPVTSLPYLPGSTVKGILRCAFMLDDGGYIAEVLEEEGIPLDKKQIAQLEEAIFGNRNPQNGYAAIGGDCMGADCFLDAYPVKADKNGHILGIENITPHRAKTKELQGLTAPVPLTLLKIMPDVVIQFRFVLTKTELPGNVEISAETKRKIFQELLLDLGAGAKTNVGFGALTAEDSKAYEGKHLELDGVVRTTSAQGNQRSDSSQQNNDHLIRNTRPNHDDRGSYRTPQQRASSDGTLARGTVLDGTVKNEDRYGNFWVSLRPGIDGRLGSKDRQLPKGGVLLPGMKVKVKIYGLCQKQPDFGTRYNVDFVDILD